MQLTVYTSDGYNFVIKNVVQASVMDMVEALKNPEEELLQFELDETVTIYVMRQHVVRVDVD